RFKALLSSTPSDYTLFFVMQQDSGTGCVLEHFDGGKVDSSPDLRIHGPSSTTMVYRAGALNGGPLWDQGTPGIAAYVFDSENGISVYANGELKASGLTYNKTALTGYLLGGGANPFTGLVA